jgi:C-terminal processing protease CtpA/Prc
MRAALKRNPSKLSMVMVRPKVPVASATQAAKNAIAAAKLEDIETLGRAALRLQVAWHRKKGTMAEHLRRQARSRLATGEEPGYHGRAMDAFHREALPEGAKIQFKVPKGLQNSGIGLCEVDNYDCPGVHQVVVERLLAVEKGKQGPAEQCGVQVGDLILTVGSRSVLGMPLRDAVLELSRAMKEDGKKLDLGVLRPDDELLTKAQGGEKRKQAQLCADAEELGRAALRVQLQWRRRKGRLAEHLMKQAQKRLRKGSATDAAFHAQQQQVK